MGCANGLSNTTPPMPIVHQVQPGDKSRISAEPQLRWDNRLSEWVPAVPGAQPRCHSAVTNALSKTNWVFQHKLAPPEKPFVTVYK